MTSEKKGSESLADRYATALLELAEESDSLEPVTEELKSLQGVIDASDDLQRMIRSPVISRAEQMKAMDAVLVKMGIGDLTRRFAGLVARNRRLFALPDMIRAYQDILAGRRGEATAEVISAKELSKAQLDAISDTVAKSVGSKVALNARVDPNLLGGLIVKVGSRMVDSSLQTKLKRLHLAMKGVG